MKIFKWFGNWILFPLCVSILFGTLVWYYNNTISDVIFTFIISYVIMTLGVIYTNSAIGPLFK